MDEINIIIFMGVLILVTIAVLSIICIRSTQKIRAQKQAKDNKFNSENDYFTQAGCVISKRIKDLLIDDIHKKWMVAGSGKIFNYSDVVAAKIVEDGSQLEMGALSVHTTIKTMSVIVSTTDTLNALIDIPIVEMKGNAGLETSSYDYAQCKKIALEQEAFFNAVIAENNNSNA